MAYTDETVKAKLSALNDTQESIVTVGQWILFHRRHAEKTVEIWAQRLKESTSVKKLTLVYLANEVIQQSKIRRKAEFSAAFSPIIVEACQVAYQGSSHEVQQKLQRVIDVWKQRQIFDPAVQDAIDKAISENEKSRGPGKKLALGGSLSQHTSPSIRPENQAFISLVNKVQKLADGFASTIKTVEAEHKKILDPAGDRPPAPVYAAKLAALSKQLAAADVAIEESINARNDLITHLKSLLEKDERQLAEAKQQRDKLAGLRNETETRKREVEDSLLLGLADEPDDDDGDISSPLLSNGLSGGTLWKSEPMASTSLERPMIEELTPPPVEPLTPPSDPDTAATTTASASAEPASVADPTPADASLEARRAGDAFLAANLPLLSAGHDADWYPPDGAAAATPPPGKRRRLGSLNEPNGPAVDPRTGYAAPLLDGIDPEVALMLAQE